MIERTVVEITLGYDSETATDAVLMSKVYQKLGFRIAASEEPKDDKKGFYLMKLECEGLKHLIFSLANINDFDLPKGLSDDLLNSFR